MTLQWNVQAVLTLAILLSVPFPAASATSSSYYDQQQQQSSTYEMASSRRERNLDHWDIDTAAAYLGLTRSSDGNKFVPLPPEEQVYAGNDASILFYAQWDQNCHTLASHYDLIGTHLDAGSSKSNLILALFDCERNIGHSQLCLAAGVKHYPTLLFVGSGSYHQTDPVTSKVLGRDKSAGPMGAVSPGLHRVVKFQGDWRYPDQVMDWIRVMRGLSRWHRLNTEGWLSAVRRGIFGLWTGGKSNSSQQDVANSLPVGVPPKIFEVRNQQSGTSGIGAFAEVKTLKQKVASMEEEKKSYDELIKLSNEAVTHASYAIDALLMPQLPNDDAFGADCLVEKTYPPYIDVYAVLNKADGWDSAKSKAETNVGDNTDANTDAASNLSETQQDNDVHLLRTCAVDLALDYCTRISQRVTADYLMELDALPESAYPELSELDDLLLARVKKLESYCPTFEKCYVNSFEDKESCRPESCPFVSDVACRYLATCLDPKIEKEYKEALDK